MTEKPEHNTLQHLMPEPISVRLMAKKGSHPGNTERIQPDDCYINMPGPDVLETWLNVA